MAFTSFIKTAFDPRSWFGASQTNLQIVGKQVKGQPFNYTNAVKFYNSWIYAAANLNAQAVASVPLRLYVRRRNDRANLFKTRPVTSKRKAYLLGDGGSQPSVSVMRKIAEFGKDWDEVDDNHPVLQLLQSANPLNNGFDLTVLRVVYQELTGNAYMHPVFSEMYQRPVALYPMPSQWVEIEPCEINFVKGYWYGPTKSQRMFFPRDEVMHFRRPNPSDLYYGIGKLEAAWGAALQNAATHDMDLALYENHARPDMLAIFKGQATPDQLDHFKSIINEELRGTKQRGKFLAVNSDVDLKPMSFPPKDMQGRDGIVEEIAAVFGVPVSMLKANDPNLASATAGYAAWKQGTILPLCRMDEEALNSLLLPLFGIENDAVLAYDNPVPADKQFELQRHTAALSGGWMTVNEIRAEQGLDPMPEPVAPPMPIGAPPPVPEQPDTAVDEQSTDEVVDQAKEDIEQKNCGIGSNGFEPGNDCAKGGGTGGGSKLKDSDYEKIGATKDIHKEQLRGLLDGEDIDVTELAKANDKAKVLEAIDKWGAGYGVQGDMDRIFDLIGSVSELKVSNNRFKESPDKGVAKIGKLDRSFSPKEVSGLVDAYIGEGYGWMNELQREMASGDVNLTDAKVKSILKAAAQAKGYGGNKEDIEDALQEMGFIAGKSKKGFKVPTTKLDANGNVKMRTETNYGNAVEAWRDHAYVTNAAGRAEASREIAKIAKEVIPRISVAMKDVANAKMSERIVYRGFQANTPEAQKFFRAISSKSKEIDMKNLTSTSTSYFTAATFAASGADGKRTKEAVLFRIKAGRGIRGNRNEDEVILPPSKYKVANVQVVTSGGAKVKIVDLEMK